MASTELSGEAKRGLDNFLFENDIQTADEIYRYDADAHRAETDKEGWTKDPSYFKKVKMSALALLKLVMHARSGGSLEVMGLMQGKIQGDTMIVMDSFALPVEGTETRVNAGGAEMAYMIEYIEAVNKVGRQENVLGWYHSHPGYGCWLSGIDVATQSLNQQHQDPWLAVVIDPVRTASAGKVELGAFRCYPKDYTPPDAQPSEYQTIPLEKIEDFGVHVKSYYQLEVSYFKSSLDTHLLHLLWNRYWVDTLASSPLLSNAGYINQQLADIPSKLRPCCQAVKASSGRGMLMGADSGKSKSSDLQKVAQDCSKVALETSQGTMSQVLKNKLFNNS
eukprot:TRINITY_DN10699_c0_g1_i2.p1 TRINITY_DN10699_c0_g1~~TRINITY_DN10699_c0_g1_i2.p1  ORF type:complete len:335 (+),score=88.42 TRINITY_DN10699_c0_g1_i2:59-1063(+)